MSEGFIPAHGGYMDLLSFQKAEIVYDATVRFCADLLDRRDRTVDQMVQAARSGKQNIVEASMASGTSKETEIKLTNVARASLEELLTDYRDYLRTRGLREWEKNSREALYVRQLSAGKIAPPEGKQRMPGTPAVPSSAAPPSPLSHSSHAAVTFAAFRPFFDSRPPEVLANIVICLIHQTNYLLDQQLKRLERDFVAQGGLRERMTRARLAERSRQGGAQRGVEESG
jgi:four helix bundle suffix protein